MSVTTGDSRIFLPTPSARRATHSMSFSVTLFDISTHALREEGDDYSASAVYLSNISTHALREEGDALFRLWRSVARHISTHALRE